jgi:uncharacterized membrane protein YcaP (DUF421 family)
MDSVLRGAAIYAFVWLILRIAGKRTLSEVTTFDLALLLIISETTQEAMIGGDHSITNAWLLILTLVGLDVAASLGKQRWPRLEHVMDGRPIVIVRDGRPLRDVMDKSRVDEDDVLAAARATQGLERMEQVKLAVLERGGGISVVPRG